MPAANLKHDSTNPVRPVLLADCLRTPTANGPMPPPPHILAAAGWWWLLNVARHAHHYNKRPRLDASAGLRINRRILQPGHTTSYIRVTLRELQQLCALLFVNPQLPRTHNWRYSALHRLIIALYALSNPHPLRKASFAFGWSVASLQHNLHEHVDLIIQHLDSHASRQFAMHL